MTDEQRYEQILDECPSRCQDWLYDPDKLEQYANELEAGIASGEISLSPESDPESDEYQGFDYVFELRSSAARIRYC